MVGRRLGGALHADLAGLQVLEVAVRVRLALVLERRWSAFVHKGILALACRLLLLL